MKYKEVSVCSVFLIVSPTTVSLRVHKLSQCLVCRAMGDLLSQPIYLALLRAVFFFSVFMLTSFSILVGEWGVFVGDLPFLLFFSLILVHQIV